MVNCSNESYFKNLIFRIRYTKGGQKGMINIALLIILCIIAGTLNTRFWSIRNFLNICEQVGDIIIILAPFTLLMVCGNFDLSVGSTVALTGVVSAVLSKVIPLPLAFISGALVGLLIGGVNAFMVLKMGINSFIATIGTMYIVKGAALILSGGTQVASVPREYKLLGNTMIFGMSIFIPVWIVCVILFNIIQKQTKLGKYAIATGSNEEAAYLTGVPVTITRMICFLLTGLAAGITGVLYASQLGAGSPTSADGLEFEVIVAAVVGGTSLDGGEGTVKGSVLGAIIVGVLQNLLNLSKVSTYWQKVALGGVLVVMVALDVLIFQKQLFSKSKKNEIDLNE